ncbi:hypothetical protein [Nocardioides soli]|uniref:hypothetical protein n=1 Tax=Nocardioides soli TaxID=1036020 RepID=UPI001C850E5D|nr:hypothetical protein [Nocardioides soli]
MGAPPASHTRMVRGVAPLLDRVGYRTVEIASSTMLATSRPLPPRGPLGAACARRAT